MTGASEDDAAAETLLLSPALVVAIWPGRLVLPIFMQDNEVGRRELLVLQELAGGRHASATSIADLLTGDADDPDIHRLVRRLVSRRVLRLVRGAHPKTASEPEAAWSAEVSVATVGMVRLAMPLSVRVGADGFQVVGHHGQTLANLTVEELLALPGLGDPFPVDRSPSPALGDDLLARLADARLLVPVGASEANRPTPRTPDEAANAQRRAFLLAGERADATELAREQATGRRRTRVVPIAFTSGPPLALGLIAAHCAKAEGGRLTERFDLRAEWEWNHERLASHTSRPAIYLCSAYVWSHAEVLEVAGSVKARSPQSIVVVGGPDAPKREQACRQYLEASPVVDVVVRGEGEQTAFELLDAIEVVDGRPRLDPAALAGVAGLTYRDGDRIVRTADRPRITDLDVLPSPFLDGWFDTYQEAPLPQVILESNRGCPYGCTFCDWGSATQSRIRQFDLGRVLAEVEWAARAQGEVLSFADANFGIFARDVEITERITELRSDTGYPGAFGANFAKNTVKHLGPIIRTLVDGGIINRGLLALQTTDEPTLATIERTNIRVERYDAIATEMRAAGLPFAVELMMGLPGATVSSFKADLQQCIDREVEGTVNPTTVLVNSPMNAPEYRRDHAVETAVDISPGAHALVVSTATFTRDDYQQMRALRRAFLLGENFGATRHIDRLVRYATGIQEIEVLERLLAEVVDDPEGADRHPFLWAMFGQHLAALVVPITWRSYIDDLVSYVRVAYPEVDPAELATAAQVQHALLPAFDREYPCEIALDHDYVAWFAAIVAAKEAGHGSSWPTKVPALSSFGPGTLHVDDPGFHARANIGCSVDHGPLLASWEHGSEVGRALYLTLES